MNRLGRRRATALLFCFALAAPMTAQAPAETYSYGAEWRFLRSGEVVLKFAGDSRTEMTLKTVGLVSTFMNVDDKYAATFDPGFCALTLLLTAHEGRKQRETKVTYDRERKSASYLEKDLKTDKVVSVKEMEIPSCVHEVTGALQKLRVLRPQPGTTIELPISDGKKLISARVDSLARERVKTPVGEFDTVKYEAFLFNGVLYRRKGRLFVWLTDDDRRMPVQIKIQLPFYIGTVTLQLEKTQTE